MVGTCGQWTVVRECAGVCAILKYEAPRAWIEMREMVQAATCARAWHIRVHPLHCNREGANLSSVDS